MALRCGFVVDVLPATAVVPGAVAEPSISALVTPEMLLAPTVESRANSMRVTLEAEASSPPM